MFPDTPTGARPAMATRLKERPTYDEDFYAWTQDQARRLRA
jgi:hypothetical protein